MYSIYPKRASLLAWISGILGITIGVFLCFYPAPTSMNILTDTFSGLVSTFLVWAAAVGIPGPGRLLSWRPIVYLGTISYGVYVWHYFVPAYATLFGFELPGKGVWRFLVVFITSICIATVSWYVLEKPLIGLKRWFPYPKAAKEDAVA